MSAAAVPSTHTSRPGVLVVDDDPFLLALLRTVLERHGFEVHAAASGEQAIDLYRRNHDTLSLALLDVCMPGLDGPHTLAELRRIDPSLRACFMSGHTGKYGADDLRASGMLQFFDKPFAINHLAEELWRLAHEEAWRDWWEERRFLAGASGFDHRRNHEQCRPG